MIVRWPGVIARLIATVVVVLGLAWLARTVGRGSLRTAWEDEPAPLLPGTQVAQPQPAPPIAGAETPDSPELKAKLRRMVDLANELRGLAAVCGGASASMQADEVEILAGLIGGAAAAPLGADLAGVRLPESATRLYGVSEPSGSGGSCVAVYRVSGGVDETAQQLRRSLSGDGWQGVRVPRQQTDNGRIVRYRKKKQDIIVYVRADRLSGETMMMVNLSADR